MMILCHIILVTIIISDLSIVSAYTHKTIPSEMGKTNPDGTVVSNLTSDMKSTRATSNNSSSSSSAARRRSRWNNHPRPIQIPPNVSINTFKGANSDLIGKVFIKGN